jgi:cell division protein FtsQ
VEVEQDWMELSLPLPRGVPRRRLAARMGRLARVLARLSASRLAMRLAIAALILTPLLGGGWLWLRNSSLVSVGHVHITGVHGAESIQIRRALDGAATRMTTMNFNAGALRSAVAQFAVVASVHVTTSFPHAVSISVVERPPVAALSGAAGRTAVAGDGTVLGPALLTNSLPILDGSVEPTIGQRVREPQTLAAVTVLGAAPAPLAPFIKRVFNGREGLTVAMRNGLLVYFGNSTRPHAKWLSLARVLTSPSAAGAWYVDVRLPERPAAGMSSASTTGSSPAEGAASAGDPTAAALAASLATAVSGRPVPSTSSGESSVAAGGESSESVASREATPSTGTTPSGEAGASTAAPAVSSTETVAPSPEAEPSG